MDQKTYDTAFQLNKAIMNTQERIDSLATLFESSTLSLSSPHHPSYIRVDDEKTIMSIRTVVMEAELLKLAKLAEEFKAL